MGYGIRRFSKELFTRRLTAVYAGVAMAAYVVFIYLYNHPLHGGHATVLYKSIGLLIAFTAVPLVFHHRRTIPILATIGYYAFGIHIFNKISAAFPRVLFQNFHVTNDTLVFTTFMACGVVFSIGMQRLLERYSFSRKFVLGMKDPAKPSLFSVPGAAVRTSAAPAGVRLSEACTEK
jgi:hypothetical protein